MKWKQRVTDGESAVHSYLQFALRDVSTLHPEKLAAWSRWEMTPERLAQFQQTERLWRTLDLVLPEFHDPAVKKTMPIHRGGSATISQWVGIQPESAQRARPRPVIGALAGN
jgi:hypothetical protein